MKEDTIITNTSQRKYDNSPMLYYNDSSSIHESENNFNIFYQQKKYMQSEEVEAFKKINQRNEASFNYISEYEDDQMGQFSMQKIKQKQRNEEETIEQHLQKNQQTPFKNQESTLKNNLTISQSSMDDYDKSKSVDQTEKFQQSKINAMQRYKQNQMDIMIEQQYGHALKYILPKIRRFYNSKTLTGKTSQLNAQMRNIIGDKCDEYTSISDKTPFQNFVNKFFSFLNKISYKIHLNKIPIFNPENTKKIIFNIIIVTYSCFYLFLVTLKIFFIAELGNYDHYFHTIAETAWVLEMIVQMNTALYHHNKFTTDRNIIMRTYLKEYFIFEFLPLIFDYLKSDHKIINLLLKLPLILKMKGITINLKYIEFYILQKLENHTILFLIKLIFSLLLFCHFLACAFSSTVAISIYFSLDETQWIRERNETLFNHDWFKSYLKALLWALQTMLGSQYQQPTSKIEIIFTCLCMIVSCIGFGYLISSIGSLLSEIDKEQKEYKQDLNILNQYMKRKQIEMQNLIMFLIYFNQIKSIIDYHLYKFNFFPNTFVLLQIK